MRQTTGEVRQTAQGTRTEVDGVQTEMETTRTDSADGRAWPTSVTGDRLRGISERTGEIQRAQRARSGARNTRRLRCPRRSTPRSWVPRAYHGGYSLAAGPLNVLCSERQLSAEAV